MTNVGIKYAIIVPQDLPTAKCPLQYSKLSNLGLTGCKTPSYMLTVWVREILQLVGLEFCGTVLAFVMLRVVIL